MAGRRVLHFLAAHAIVIVLASTAYRPVEAGSVDDSVLVKSDYLDDCGIWLAPSTLPGAGLGIFAGKDFAKAERLQKSGDVVVPIVDIMMHQKGRGRFIFLWDEYTWNGKSLGIGHEVIKECNAASAGFGAAANSFLDLINVDEGDPTNSMPSGLHRSTDPGVGAFTTYHNRESKAKVAIKAGQELFVNYGQHWFEQRYRLGPIPLRRGLKKSTNFYRKFRDLRENNPQVGPSVYEAIWDEFVKNTEWNESRIFGAFFNTQEERDLLDKNWTLKQIRVKDSMRTTDWLKEHGTCADNLREGVSTIKQAGRGAFATRTIPKGAVVSALPLIQIVDKKVLEMYDFKDIKNKKLNERKRIGYQLLMNYCFGHTNSTMLLCQYGNLANLVNHNRTSVNVELRWADPDRGNHHPDMLAKTIDEFADDRTAKLAMDLVATRDIKEGEEVFLDYGEAWEKAWQKHVENWNIKDADDYVSSYMMNREENTTALRTEYEQLSNPYPGNINVECDSNIWTRINQTLFNTTHVINITKPDSHEFWLCDVLRQRVVNGTTLYTVVVTRPPPKKKKKKQEVEPPKDEIPPEPFLELSDIPRMAIRFTDRPYTSDMFLTEAFRHHIGIPDSIFPEKWMNFSPI